MRSSRTVLLLFILSFRTVLAVSQSLEVSIVNLKLQDDLSPSSVKGGGCTQACTTLSKILSKANVSYSNSLIYKNEQSEYFAQQQSEVTPLCRITPSTSKEVAIAVIVSQVTQCQFAIKSGGHGFFAGASNIQGGVTIDLSQLNEINFNRTSMTTYVGAGNLWGDVYSRLDAYNVTVSGGRVSSVGVGGLTLGGGISFFAGHRGYACDGIKNYEVVLADGRIVNASTQRNSDLYWALRGGGNNFGIVTRFDMDTFPHGLMWGGSTIYSTSYNASLFSAFENFAINHHEDPSAAMFLSAVYTGGKEFFDAGLTYDKPVSNPPIFSNFTTVPSISSTQRIATLFNLTEEIEAGEPKGYRQAWATVTFKNSGRLQAKIMEICKSHVNSSVPDYLVACSFQPITKQIAKSFESNGGNALGISIEECPLTMFNFALQWSNSSYDAQQAAARDAIINESLTAGEAMGLSNRFIYQNYASLNQDVFAGYGAASLKRLREVAKEYDPEGVFQKLQPGYFKLN